MDARTGRALWRLAANLAGSRAGTSDAVSISGDDAFLVFAAPVLGGWEMQRAELATGVVTSFALRGNILPRSFSVHPDGERVLVIGGQALWASEIASGRNERVMDLAPLVPVGGSLCDAPLTVTRDGVATVVGSRSADGTLTLAVLDLERRRIETALPVPGVCGERLLGCPTAVHLVAVMDVSGAATIVDLQAGHTRAFTAAGATWGYWAADGKRFFFHHPPLSRSLPGGISSCDQRGGDQRNHYANPRFALGSGALSGDGRFVVAEAQVAEGRALVLIDLATAVAEILCWLESSSQPSFSRSRRYATFTASMGGTTQILIMPLL